MKVYNSLNKKNNQKVGLIDDRGNIRFNNQKSKIDSKGKTKSSQKWLSRQINDPYANAAKIEGYLARSAYKLLEIQKKYNIFEPKIKIIIDLGCSPGSWSQVILTNEKLHKKQIIGVDLLPIKFNHPNLHFIQGDFEDVNIQQNLILKLQEITKNETKQQADCIICDIALNNIGDKETDRLRSERIIELCITFCKSYLIQGGNFVCKALKGADNVVFNELKDMFKFVYRFKPNSSRKDSSEIFLICLCKK